MCQLEGQDYFAIMETLAAVSRMPYMGIWLTETPSPVHSVELNSSLAHYQGLWCRIRTNNQFCQLS